MEQRAPRIIVAGGMGLAADITRLLADSDAAPVLLIGYDASLAHRSNYCSLQPLARRYEIPLLEVRDLNGPDVLQAVKEAAADWMVIAGWSQLAAPELLSAPRLGTLGYHMSRLPQGRGRAPVAWTLIKGLDTAWVTLQRLKPGVDDGEIVDQRAAPIDDFDDAATVVAKVNRLACDTLRDLLPQLADGNIPLTPQDDGKASYWPKRRPEDGEIDWNLSARQIFNFVRGTTDPFPGAFTFLDGERVQVWRTAWLPQQPSDAAGTILGPCITPGPEPEAGVAVAARDGILVLRDIGRNDAPHMNVREIAAFAERHVGKKFSGRKNDGAERC